MRSPAHIQNLYMVTSCPGLFGTVPEMNQNVPRFGKVLSGTMKHLGRNFSKTKICRFCNFISQESESKNLTATSTDMLHNLKRTHQTWSSDADVRRYGVPIFSLICQSQRVHFVQEVNNKSFDIRWWRSPTDIRTFSLPPDTSPGWRIIIC